MALPRLQDLARGGADEAVPADPLRRGALEEERVGRVVAGARVRRDLEVGGGRGDEVGRDLAVDGDQVGGLGARGSGLGEEGLDGLEGGDDTSLESRVSVAFRRRASGELGSWTHWCRHCDVCLNGGSGVMWWFVLVESRRSRRWDVGCGHHFFVPLSLSVCGAPAFQPAPIHVCHRSSVPL